MLIDAHCHLDVAEFDTDRDAVIAVAQAVAFAVLLYLPRYARVGKTYWRWVSVTMSASA